MHITGLINSTESQWEGVMGALINGTYQMSISRWIMYPLRTPIIDWCPSHYYTTNALVMKYQPNNTDMSLYLRPFTWRSWIAILFQTSAIILTLNFINCQRNSQLDSGFIVETIGWYFFLLLSSFYSGALVSYFTNKNSIPFSSMTDVINAYPGMLTIRNTIKI